MSLSVFPISWTVFLVRGSGPYAIWGMAIGTLGGLIGLGGAEFRLPVLNFACRC